MKKIIVYLVLIFSLNFIAGQIIYYELNLDYNNGDVNITSFDIKFSQNKLENIMGLYTAIILDDNREILNIILFGIPNEILWDGIDPETKKISHGGLLILDQTSFEIFIPYYENAKEIIIYDGNFTEVARRGISEYSKQREERTVEEKIDDEQEYQKREKLFIEILAEYWWILLIILLVVLFFFLRKGGVSKKKVILETKKI